MNKKIKIILYLVLVVLFILILVAIFKSSDGLIKITKSNDCKTQEIGYVKEEDKTRKVFSYCLEGIDLNKVKLSDGSVSFSKLTEGLKQTNCIWDGGTCTYKGKDYYIVACQKLWEDNNIVITANDIDYDFIYDNFCSTNVSSFIPDNPTVEDYKTSGYVLNDESEIINYENYERFMTQYQNKIPSKLGIIQYTIEGAPIFYIINYEPGLNRSEKVIISIDNTKDKYSKQEDKKIIEKYYIGIKVVDNKLYAFNNDNDTENEMMFLLDLQTKNK